MTGDRRTAEDDARALLFDLGVYDDEDGCGADARYFSNGDLVILANLIAFAGGVVHQLRDGNFEMANRCLEKLESTLAAIRSLEVPK